MPLYRAFQEAAVMLSWAEPVWVSREVVQEGWSQEQPSASAGASSGAAVQVKAQEELSDAREMLH